MFGFFSKKRQESKFEKFIFTKLDRRKPSKDILRRFNIYDDIFPSHDMAADLWLKLANIHIGAVINSGYELEEVIEEGMDTFFIISRNCGAPEISGKMSCEIKAGIFGRIIAACYGGYGDNPSTISELAWQAHSDIFSKDDELRYNLHVEINNALKRVPYMRCQDEEYPAMFGIEKYGDHIWVAESDNLEFTALLKTSGETGEINYYLTDEIGKESVPAILEQIERRKQELFSTQSTI